LSSDASSGAAERDEDEAAWSSDYSNSDEEDINQDPFGADTSEVFSSFAVVFLLFHIFIFADKVKEIRGSRRLLRHGQLRSHNERG